MCARVCARARMRVHACVRACVFVCVCVCARMCACVCTCVSACSRQYPKFPLAVTKVTHSQFIPHIHTNWWAYTTHRKGDDVYKAKLESFSPCPSLLSLVVSVDVKHHVYLLTFSPCEPVWLSGKALGW